MFVVQGGKEGKEGCEESKMYREAFEIIRTLWLNLSTSIFPSFLDLLLLRSPKTPWLDEEI